MNSPRLIQTYLTDGTLEGIRVVDPEGDIEGYVIPRLKLADAKKEEKLSQPAVYILLNADDNRAYIGESESFYTRVGQHLKGKAWWTLAVAIVSKNNDLEKGDVKYLESLAVERARGGSARIENNTIPPRNNIQRFKVHKLERILDDAQLVLTSLGYDIFTSKTQTENETIWYCRSKLTDAKAVFRGEKFVVLAGSQIDKSHTASFESGWPQQVIERHELFSKFGIDRGGYIELQENIPFKSPNHAGHIVTGRSVNAWTTWKTEDGHTMDEVMRRVD